MKEFRFKWLVLAFAVCLVFGLSSPVSAGNGLNGNGFPDGEHFNLNLLGKKSDPNVGGYFKCPSVDAYRYAWWMENDDGVPCVPATGIGCTKCDPDADGTPGNQGECLPGAAKDRNVIFVPRDNNVNGDQVSDLGISLTMISGANKPGRNKTGTTDQSGWCDTSIHPNGCLEVTDWCTQHFPNDGTDPGFIGYPLVPDPQTPGLTGATFSLPPHENGYDVYARVTGKPLQQDRAFAFLEPSVGAIRDEFGNILFDSDGTTLLKMGVINPGAGKCYDADGDPVQCVLDRTGSKGKGVQKAVSLDFEAFLNYSGQVCYVNDTCFYCETWLTVQKLGSEPANPDDLGQRCVPGDESTWPANTVCSPLGTNDCAVSENNPAFANLKYTGAGGDPDFVCCFDYNKNNCNDAKGNDLGDCPAGDHIYYIDENGNFCDPEAKGRAKTWQTCEKGLANDTCGATANYDCRLDASAYADVYTCSTDNSVCYSIGAPCGVGGFCTFNSVECSDANAAEVTPACRTYEDVWIFNVADFVDIWLETETYGAYVVQLRFYPRDTAYVPPPPES